MRRVAVIGVGVTKFGKHDRTSSELFAEAAADALADAEISASRVQALYYGNVVGSETEHQLHTGPQAASILGIPRSPRRASRPRAPRPTPRSVTRSWRLRRRPPTSSSSAA